jgi:hypothetical protein
VVAGLLHRFGIFMGDNLGHQYEDPKFKTIEPEKLARTIAERNKEYQVWGWKLPNTIYYFSKIEHMLRNPHLVVVYRDPLSIAMSSATYDERVLNQRLLDIPIRHYQKMHQVIGNTTYPRLVCSYEGLLQEPTLFVGTLAKFCGVELFPLEDCRSFINPEKGYQAP